MVKERREARIAPDEVQHDVFRCEVAKGFVRGHERRTGGAVHEGARVEAVLRTEHGLDLLGVALLDRALDDHVQFFGRLAGGDYRFARRPVPDVELGPELCSLTVGEPVKRGVLGIEGLRHDGARVEGSWRDSSGRIERPVRP